VNSQVKFSVLNSSGTEVWTSTVASRSSSVNNFGVATYNTSAANVYTLNIDYMGLWLAPRAR
jgi:uncharacterized protein YfaS (alpha-2-macroglobulin family)